MFALIEKGKGKWMKMNENDIIKLDQKETSQWTLYGTIKHNESNRMSSRRLQAQQRPTYLDNNDVNKTNTQKGSKRIKRFKEDSKKIQKGLQ